MPRLESGTVCIEHGANVWYEEDARSKTGWSMICEAGTRYRIAKSRPDLLAHIKRLSEARTEPTLVGGTEGNP